MCSFSETCRLKGLDGGAILLEIDAARSEPVERGRDYAAWALPFLADYIVNTHHGYLKENMGQIAVYARKIAEVHGTNHPEVIEIAAIFDRIATDMTAHLREEEEVLFPAIRRINAARTAGATPEPTDVESVQVCLAKLGQEHEEIGDAIHAIRHLSGSTPYRTTPATPSLSPTGSSRSSRTTSTSMSTWKTTFFSRRRHNS